ncbi:MAG TPA: LPS export ABC transporter ATP-binding protein [Gammaproteobacteria bacterium]|mgnify:CR=1 FL=1|nr:LPS export ABC transporter ATP-binding protein [Gammaproteobacteria bacterium]
MSILRAENLLKRYKSRTIVNNVSLSIKTGEVVGLLGPNGAGKTTSFYMIVGLIKCDKGRIILDNQDITRIPMHARAQAGIGYLPQEASIFRKLSVAENIMAILETRKDLSPQKREAELENLLHDLHIGHISDNEGISLSGGERRRAEIARALATNPDFMLFDEPFAGVDPISVVDIQQIIQHLRQRNIGILITDHNVRETLGICSSAYILSEGQVIAEGVPESILDNQQVREVYLGHDFSL